ncbi:MAG: hypothetical protein JSS56_04035, partial [Proteobacteria bacterium]|nr:hypothetical protein [Pseudomonadota bacterium]
MFAFKLVAAPLLLAVASWVMRRWGEAIGGLIVGLPLTSGPISVFLAVEHGADFATYASVGSLVATTAQASFCVAYCSVAKRGWIAAVAAGILGFSATAGTLVSLNLSHAALFFMSMLAVYLTIRYWPVGAPRTVQLQAAWWDVPSRMLLIAGLVLGVTYLAPLAGPSVSGVIASFPFM